MTTLYTTAMGRSVARGLDLARTLVAPAGRTYDACTSVLPAGEGVCATCHAAARPGRLRCATCVRTRAQVSRPAPLVVPISLFQTGDRYWYLLRRYKDGWDAAERRALRRQLARILAQFLRFHLGCLAPGPLPRWRITTVPPTHRRGGARPLEELVRQSPWLARHHVRVLRTARAPGHNAACDTAFRVTRRVAGRSFVLIDDTLTTGASIHSAASALQLAGARVLAVVVLGRVVNPGAAPLEAALWQVARGRPFRLDRCCLCDRRP